MDQQKKKLPVSAINHITGSSRQFREGRGDGDERDAQLSAE